MSDNYTAVTLDDLLNLLTEWKAQGYDMSNSWYGWDDERIITKDAEDWDDRHILPH